MNINFQVFTTFAQLSADHMEDSLTMRQLARMLEEQAMIGGDNENHRLRVEAIDGLIFEIIKTISNKTKRNDDQQWNRRWR